MIRYPIVIILLLIFSTRILAGVNYTFTSSSPIAKKDAFKWREDLAYLKNELISIHPNPFFAISKSKFEARVKDINNNIPNMNRSQIILSFMSLVATIGNQGRDGHTGLWPYQATANFNLYPIRLYWFKDGIYVVDSDDTELIGSKLESINGYPTEDLLKAVDIFITRDGPMWVKSWAPVHILSPEFQVALGFADNAKSAVFTFSNPGKTTSKSLFSVPHTKYHKRFPMLLWTGALPEANTPHYLNRKDDYYWYEEWPDERTLYFQYNAVTLKNKAGVKLTTIVAELKAIMTAGHIDRLIIDARSNGGGNNMAYGPLLEFLQGPIFENNNRLYVITGRITFSAGVNFITDLEKMTNTHFVGEATGGSPNQFGDPKAITLPHSKVRVRVSARYWNKAGDDDQRLEHQPNTFTPLTSDDYFNQQDPAINYILQRENTLEAL